MTMQTDNRVAVSLKHEDFFAQPMVLGPAVDVHFDSCGFGDGPDAPWELALSDGATVYLGDCYGHIKVTAMGPNSRIRMFLDPGSITLTPGCKGELVHFGFGEIIDRTGGEAKVVEKDVRDLHEGETLE
jgi:hypothetical protein